MSVEVGDVVFTNGNVISINGMVTNNRFAIEGPEGIFFTRANTPLARIMLNVTVSDTSEGTGRDDLQSFYSGSFQDQFRFADQHGYSWTVKFAAPPKSRQREIGSKLYFHDLSFEVDTFSWGSGSIPTSPEKWVESTEEFVSKSVVEYTISGARYRSDYRSPARVWSYKLINLTRPQMISVVSLLGANFYQGLGSVPVPQYDAVAAIFEQNSISFYGDESAKYQVGPLRFVEVPT